METLICLNNSKLVFFNYFFTGELTLTDFIGLLKTRRHG
jgi:hypothetical protein